MRDDEWDSIAGVLEEWWPGEFADTTSASWRLGLDDYEFDAVGEALRAVALRQAQHGEKFRPSMPEVLAMLLGDPSRPTFSEMLVLARRALRAGNRPLTGSFAHEGEMILARERLVLDAAEQMHPLAGGFIGRYGVGRLRDDLGDMDGDYGAVRARDLEAAWREHCDAFEGREAAALVAGRRGEGLARLDPLAALVERADCSLAPEVTPRVLDSGSGQ